MPYTVIGWISTGYTGSPGYTRFKFNGSLDAAQATARATAVRSFLGNAGPEMPSGLSFACEPTAKVYTDAGELQSEFVIPSLPVAVSGGSATKYAGGTGCVVQWNTGTVHGGRKIKGRTYIVPLTSAAFDTDGTLTSAFVSSLQTAGNALVAGTPELVVSSKQAGGGSAGPRTANVISCTVFDRAATLRSRRR